jgi:hypothetical protein
MCIVFLTFGSGLAIIANIGTGESSSSNCCCCWQKRGHQVEVKKLRDEDRWQGGTAWRRSNLAPPPPTAKAAEGDRRSIHADFPYSARRNRGGQPLRLFVGVEE